jgi:hypothetical protein
LYYQVLRGFLVQRKTTQMVDTMTSLTESSTSLFTRFNFWLKDRELEKELIEHVVETVEPKIRLASGYRKHLGKPVQICLDYCRKMVEEIPGPIALKKSDYDADPLIHAVFIGAPVTLRDLIRQQEKSSNLPQSEGLERFAILTMVQKETTVFGPKNDGGMIIQDARMKSLTFSDHKIVGLATSLDSSRNKLANVCFEMILGAVSKELAAKRTDIRELHEHLERLRAMSHIFLEGSQPKSFFGHDNPDDPEKLKKVEGMLKVAEDELINERQGYETPEDWLEILIDNLSVPENVMHIKSLSLRLDWRNVITESADEKANDIYLAQCSLADHMKREAVLISYVNEDQNANII